MVNFGPLTLAEQLRMIAANLGRVYPPVPTEETDLRALIANLRASGRVRNVHQLCAGVSPDDEEAHLIVCPACGQLFDCRDRAQVEHHSNDDHRPKLVIRLS